ncbi:hypothetical protein IEQ34_000859 [Dendrobium chrysotoxum]|uniref:Bromo domain-containing protein n=1 Tax=Dendrobium chrysotoxum TaxID=161865 RepID=A0AAV7HPP8_DENCH|nr:hypothetical protein IEQ34_000859 [Dendrobium chrysotoxum]
MLGSFSEKPFIVCWPLSSFLPAAVGNPTNQSFFPIKRAPFISEAASTTTPIPVHYKLTVSVPATASGDDGIKENLPPQESFKKSRVNGIKNEQVFKKCCVLISKLMKHKHRWVFNALVDPNAFGIPDYHKIITHSMVLATVKSRLSRHWYNAPKELAEDVRLIFHNMNILAQQPQQIFEELWLKIEADLAYLRSPLVMKRSLFLDMRKTSKRSHSTISPLGVDLKKKSLNQFTHSGQPVASKKPRIHISVK